MLPLFKMDSMNEEFIDTIITNLKIISMVQVNEKLCIRKGHLQIDNSSNFQFFKRWLFRDSRDIVLVYLRDLIRNITILFNKVNEYSKSESLWILSRILAELDSAILGMGNLKTTYTEDPYMVVTFDNLINKFKELTQKGRSLTLPESKGALVANTK
jgi:hypothetical protein